VNVDIRAVVVLWIAAVFAWEGGLFARVVRVRRRGARIWALGGLLVCVTSVGLLFLFGLALLPVDALQTAMGTWLVIAEVALFIPGLAFFLRETARVYEGRA
jgi:hypothetical protein